MLKDILLVGAGGFAGSVLRYLLSVAFLSASIKSNFPVGTLIINASGALLIGVLISVVPSGGWQTLSIAGFCGGFTTFSAFSLEAVKLIKNGSYTNAVFYILASVVVCMLFVWLGMVAGNKIDKGFI